MKKNLWIVFAAALSTSVMAQDATNSAAVLQAPPPEPPPATTTAMPAMPAIPAVEAPTNAPTTATPTTTTTKSSKKSTTAKKKAPAKKSATTASKTAAKKKSPELKTVPLVAGPAVVSANHVNVRSKAGLVGEVLAHLTNGSPVTVLEEVNLKKSGPDEPSAWAKILLPPETHVWIKSSLLENNAVGSKKVNLRAGPGEEYGIVGTVVKGDAVQVIDTKGDWTQIQAPTNAYAFIAAQYLRQEEGGAGATVAAAGAAQTPEAVPTTTTAMPDMPTVAAPPTEAPGAGATNAEATAATAVPTMPTMPTTPDTTMAPAAQEPPPPRIVDHEGIVRGSFSIQAPTKYQLVSPDTKQPIDYLYTTSTNLDLSRYKGMHIIVTGEEAIDPRWRNTPVITIQAIKVLD